MEITQEHFDKQLENLHTNITQDITSKIDQQTIELKTYIHESFKTQQVYVEERFKETISANDVRKDVEALKIDMQKIKDALALNSDQPVKV